MDADAVDGAGGDDGEAAAEVVADVAVLVGDGGADAGVNGGVGDETFFVGEVEECAVVYSAGVGQVLAVKSQEHEKEFHTHNV